MAGAAKASRASFFETTVVRSVVVLATFDAPETQLCPMIDFVTLRTLQAARALSMWVHAMTGGCTDEAQKVAQAQSLLTDVGKREFRLLWNTLCAGAVAEAKQDLPQQVEDTGNTEVLWRRRHWRLAALVSAVSSVSS